MLVNNYAQKTMKWDYQNSESFITIVAFLCDEPAWIRQENGVVMGLYNIGRESFWIEKSKIDARKQKPFPCEATIDEVVGRMANRLLIDGKTGEVMFRYLLDDGRIAEFSSSVILKKRGELSCLKYDNLKKSLKEEDEYETY